MTMEKNSTPLQAGSEVSKGMQMVQQQIQGCQEAHYDALEVRARDTAARESAGEKRGRTVGATKHADASTQTPTCQWKDTTTTCGGPPAPPGQPEPTTTFST